MRTKTARADDLTLDEIKAHLRLDGTDEDGVLTALQSASRRFADTVGAYPVTGWDWRDTLIGLSAIPETLTIEGVPFEPFDVGVEYTEVGGGTATFSDYTVTYDRLLRCFLLEATSAPPDIEPDTTPVAVWSTTTPADSLEMVNLSRKMFVGKHYEFREDGEALNHSTGEALILTVIEPGGL